MAFTISRRTAGLTVAALAATTIPAFGQPPPVDPAPPEEPPVVEPKPAPTPKKPRATVIRGRVLGVDSANTVRIRSGKRVIRVTLAGVGDPGGRDARAACLREGAVDFMRRQLPVGHAVTVRSRGAVRKGSIAGWLNRGVRATGVNGTVNRAVVVSGRAPVSANVARTEFPRQMRRAERIARGKRLGRWGTACDLSTTAGVQRRLISLGYLPSGTAHGRYDYRTMHAVMAFQGYTGLPRTGSLSAATTRRLASATRPVPRERRPGRRMEVHIQRQVVLLIENNRVVRAIHVSSGARTPRGRFTINRREIRSWSVPFSTTLPYAQYFLGGFAFHEYPSVPGYAASAGCVRLPRPEAQVVWNFGAYGMPVTIR